MPSYKQSIPCKLLQSMLTRWTLLLPFKRWGNSGSKWLSGFPRSHASKWLGHSNPNVGLQTPCNYLYIMPTHVCPNCSLNANQTGYACNVLWTDKTYSQASLVNNKKFAEAAGESGKDLCTLGWGEPWATEPVMWLFGSIWAYPEKLYGTRWQGSELSSSGQLKSNGNDGDHYRFMSLWYISLDFSVDLGEGGKGYGRPLRSMFLLINISLALLKQI